MARFWTKERDGQIRMRRGAENLARVSMQSARHVDRDARNGRLVDRANGRQRNTFKRTHESGSEQGVHDESGSAEQFGPKRADLS